MDRYHKHKALVSNKTSYSRYPRRHCFALLRRQSDRVPSATMDIYESDICMYPSYKIEYYCRISAAQVAQLQSTAAKFRASQI